MPPTNLPSPSTWNLPFLVHSSQISTTDFLLQQDFHCGKLGDQLENLWNEQQYYTASSDKTRSLSNALMKMFAIRFFFLGVFLFLSEFFTAIGTALLLKKMLSSSKDGVLFCLVGSLLVGGVKQALHHYSLLRCACLETTARVACSSLIHRKILKLKPNVEALHETNEICKLLLARFNVKYVYFSANAAASFLAIPIFCYSLAEIDSILFSFVVCIVSASARHYFSARNKLTKNTPEDSLSKLLKVSSEMLLHKFWLTFPALFSTHEMVLISLVLFENIQTTISLAPQALTDFSAMLKSLQSCEKLLLNEDVFKRQFQTRRCIFQRKQKRIVLKNAWAKSENFFLLRGVNFQAKDKEVTAIIGGASSGKTSLVNVLLGEILLEQGKLEMASDVSYSPQLPWILPGKSLRENIVFNEELDLEKYEEVVEVCELDDFVRSEDTLDSESDEIKAKINLARAVYKSSAVYVLDEPLLKLPEETAHRIYEKCICGYLKKKCVVLACNSSNFELLKKNVQSFYVMEKGAVVSTGSSRKLTKTFDIPPFLHQQNQSEEKEDETQIPRRDEILEEDADYVFRIFQIFVVFAIGSFLDFLLEINSFTAVLSLFALGLIFVLVCGNRELCLILDEKLKVFSVTAGQFVSNSKRKVDVNVFVGKTVAGFVCAGCFGVILMVVDVWTLLASGALWIGVFYMDSMVTPQRKHLEASLINQIRVIEGSLACSVRGVATIRAFKAQNKLINEFDALHDRFRSINYAILCLKSSTSFWSGLFTLLYVTLVNLSRVLTLGNENFGLALAQTLMTFSSSIMVASLKSF